MMQLQPICSRLERLHDTLIAREEVIAKLDSSAVDMQATLKHLQAVEAEKQQVQAEAQSLQEKVSIPDKQGHPWVPPVSLVSANCKQCPARHFVDNLGPETGYQALPGPARTNFSASDCTVWSFAAKEIKEGQKASED